MRRLSAIAFGAITALLLQACETDINLKQIESSGSRIYINAFMGDRDTTYFKILKTIPIGVKGGNSKDIDITTLKFTVNGVEKPLARGTDSIWFNVGDCKPGSDVAIEVEARGLGKASAHSSIPSLPKAELQRDTVTYNEGKYMRFRLKVEDNPDEEDFYGLIMMSNITTIEDGNDYGTYSNSMWFTKSLGGNEIEDLMGGNDLMTCSYYDWISGHSDDWAQMNFFSDKELKDGVLEFFSWYYPDIIDEEYEWYEGYDPETGTWTTSTHTQTQIRTFSVRIYNLSAECYRHMRADYMKSTNALSELGLTAPNFTYCNIKNGYGIFCGLSKIEFEMDNI